MSKQGWCFNLNDWKKNQNESAIYDSNPTVLAKMKSGFAVFGYTQFLPGYCVLLSYPKIVSLNDLPLRERSGFLLDMTIIGDAITQVYNPIRMNYEILGYTDAFLHAHIFPRYEWEETKHKTKSVWLYDEDNWSNSAFQYDQVRYQERRLALQKKFIELIDSYKTT